jgi:hypothetical protein
LIKRKPGFSKKIFWNLEIPFKIGFTVFDCVAMCGAFVQTLGGGSSEAVKSLDFNRDVIPKNKLL